MLPCVSLLIDEQIQYYLSEQLSISKARAREEVGSKQAQMTTNRLRLADVTTPRFTTFGSALKSVQQPDQVRTHRGKILR
jgi:hypothetical protein